jgi:hypothetical protein
MAVPGQTLRLAIQFISDEEKMKEYGPATNVIKLFTAVIYECS